MYSWAFRSGQATEQKKTESPSISPHRVIGPVLLALGKQRCFVYKGGRSEMLKAGHIESWTISCRQDETDGYRDRRFCDDSNDGSENPYNGRPICEFTSELENFSA